MTIKCTAALLAALTLWGATAQAAYTETMTKNSPSVDLVKDYGLVDDNAASNQSRIFQKAIDDLARRGGGRLIVPKGTYQIAEVYLKSNVHILVEKDTVFKPYWPEGTKTALFLMDAKRGRRKNISLKEDQAFIENVSIRGLGGRFIVDYSDRQRRKGEGIRTVLCKMVRNFMISDLDIKDNFTVYCGITLTPTRTKRKDVSAWPVSRSTDGTIRNCRIFNASPGYGLTQLHGAQSVHFEDIYSNGGVTLRLETGAVGAHTAVYDVSGKNIVAENGRCAVMLGPHSAMNGVVRVDGVMAKSCTYAVTVGKGGVKKAELKRNPDAKDGIFAAGSYIKNIHAVFGMNAQVKTHALQMLPEEYLDDLRVRRDSSKFFDGPSIGAVKDSSGDLYTVKLENITLEGFKHHNKPILGESDARPGKWGKTLKKWKADYSKK